MSHFLFPPGFCISPLQTCHLPWTHFSLEYWAGICRGASGHKVVRGREVKNGWKAREKEIIWPPHQESGPLPTHDALRPRGAALPRSHAPLYHPNLLIVEAQLAHGGFLLQPTRINQTETVAESAQPLRPVVLHPFLSFALFSVSFKWAWPKRWVFFKFFFFFSGPCTTDPISGVAFSLFSSPPARFLLCDLKQKKMKTKESMLLIFVFMC